MGAEFLQLKMDTHVYTSRKRSKIIILGKQVHDQAIAGPNKRVVTEFKKELGDSEVLAVFISCIGFGQYHVARVSIHVYTK